MRRPIRFAVMAAVAVAGALAFGACSNNVPTTVNTPAPTTTDTFTGTLTANGAKVFTFSTLAAGTATATLTAVTPDSTTQVGLALGTWNGSSCQVIIANDGAVQGVTLTGTVNGAGTLCVRVYDATGTLPNAEDFTVTVVHP